MSAGKDGNMDENAKQRSLRSHNHRLYQYRADRWAQTIEKVRSWCKFCHHSQWNVWFGRYELDEQPPPVQANPFPTRISLLRRLSLWMKGTLVPGEREAIQAFFGEHLPRRSSFNETCKGSFWPYSVYYHDHDAGKSTGTLEKDAAFIAEISLPRSVLVIITDVGLVHHRTIDFPIPVSEKRLEKSIRRCWKNWRSQYRRCK